MFEKNLTLIKLLESWNTKECVYTNDEILKWIEERNNTAKVNIEKTEFLGDGKWFYDESVGRIVNCNRTFFSISGITKEKKGQIIQEQPIIIQPEIGYLGIICKEINGVLHFLMQAKIEPGNINKIQISPTIQATKSNFMQTHGGKVPPYLEYFYHKHDYEVVYDQIQSEQSSRFYGKRNRNIVIKLSKDDEIEILPSHKWMTLGQIKHFMTIYNLVNMDTRTVISGLPFSLHDFSYKEMVYMQSLVPDRAFFNSMFDNTDCGKINKIYQYMNELKMLDDSKVSFIDLYKLNNWKLIDNRDFSSDKGDFKIVYCNISIEGREVQTWSQPLFESKGKSLFGLACVEKHGKYRFLVRAFSEIGCFDKIEIGPTVQIPPVYNKDNLNPVEKEFLKCYEQKENVLQEGIFSEEGGRFYHEENRNVILKFSDYNMTLPEGYFWLDFYSLNVLIQFNNCLNIQLRNLLSMLRMDYSMVQGEHNK